MPAIQVEVVSRPALMSLVEDLCLPWGEEFIIRASIMTP